jgi:uncharacterized Zn-binding protein involved in type VI secretion
MPDAAPMNILVPRPGGIYDADVADLFEDIPWLISATAHARKGDRCSCCTVGWCAREDVLIKQFSEDRDVPLVLPA